jgi:hypothetical protein
MSYGALRLAATRSLRLASALGGEGMVMRFELKDLGEAIEFSPLGIDPQFDAASTGSSAAASRSP